jgi:hypothetical protein
MGFSRIHAPLAPPAAEALTAAMVGIGMNFAASSAKDPNIEDTLLFASIEAMEGNDLRVLALLVSWFGVHSAWVNADRLTALVESAESPRVRALWAALARWQARDRRFARLGGVYAGDRLDLLSRGTDFQVERHGEDSRLAGGPLRVPGNVLRERPGDVLSPRELARRHNVYRHRVIMGPTYRADMWSLLESDSGLSTAEVARRAYGSFATAWHVKRDFGIVGDAKLR